jgi:hypothetical protein
LQLRTLVTDSSAGFEALTTIIKPDQGTEAMMKLIMRETGMEPGFYVNGTGVVVTHKLNLDLLKRINYIDYVVSIKASSYSAGAALIC